jgi:hypothetical protein
MTTNVDNYTISELLQMIELDENNLSESAILKKTNKLIEKFKSENNSKLTLFFQKIQYKLLLYLKQTEETGNASEFTSNDKQTNDWWSNEALKQNDKIQTDKITERKQKIDVYDNEHVPMKKQELGVNNGYVVPIAQDKLNPKLENITKRIVNLDSQFRQASGGIDSISTDYTLDLSDPLIDVLSLNLYSIQIPYSWYVIDYQYGNTCFWVVNKDIHYNVSIEPGNYSASDFVTTLNESFAIAGFTANSSGIFVSYNTNNAKISLILDGAIDPNGNIIIAESDAYFLFFDFTGEYICTETSGCQAQNLAINGTLGWLMGFRLPQVPILSINTPPAIIDLYGTKYLILVIDDFNKNHINNGLVTITEISNTLDIPPYYNPTTPHNCSNLTQDISQLQQEYQQSQNIGYNLTEKITILYKNIPTVLPTAPRIMTQAQIYSVNQIIKNREKTTSYRGKAPTSSDTFALIPVKHSGLSTGDLYVEFSGVLQDNKRNYFGPVDISRMHIKLLDDRGFTVDLHGAEWSVTLVSTSLYQY